MRPCELVLLLLLPPQPLLPLLPPLLPPPLPLSVLPPRFDELFWPALKLLINCFDELFDVEPGLDKLYCVIAICCFGLVPGCGYDALPLLPPEDGKPIICLPPIFDGLQLEFGLEPLCIESHVDERDRNATGESPPA